MEGIKMSSEKMKILSMVEEKIISVEEGLKLLEALGSEKAKENVVVLDKDGTQNQDVEESQESVEEKEEIRIEEKKDQRKHIKFEKLSKLEKLGDLEKLDILGKDFEKKIEKKIEQGVEFLKDNIAADENGEKITREYNLKAFGKEQIRFEFTSGDLNIITEDREDVKIVATGYGDPNSEADFLNITDKGNEILIQENFGGGKAKKSFFGLFKTYEGVDIELHLPASFKNTLAVKCVSGDIDIRNIEVDTLEISTISGDLDANVIHTKNCVLTSTSGDVEVADYKGELLFSTVSGDIDINFTELAYDISGKTVSGDVEIALPSLAEFGIALKTLSGDLECEFPITMIGGNTKHKMRGKVVNDDVMINLATTSGDVEINKSKY